jgi:chromosome segregation ATPase
VPPASTAPDSLDRLADALRRVTADLEAQNAAAVRLQGRLEALEAHLASTQAAQADLAVRLEQLARGAQAPPRGHLDSQLEALRAGHSHTEERLERLADRVDTLGRLEARVAELRTELSRQIDAQDRALRTELATLAERRAADDAELGREIQLLQERLNGHELYGGRLEMLDRRQGEVALAQQQLAVRAEDIAEQRTRLEDAMRRYEQQLEARVDGLSARVNELQEELAAWRQRIDAQDETLRAARTVADEVRTEAVRLQEAHHASAEAQRIAERRTADAVEAVRRESAGEWERFRAERRQDWERLAAATAERDAAQARAMASGLEAAERRAAALEAGLAAEHDHRTAALAALRTALELMLRRWGEAMSELEAALGERAASPQAPGPAERRQALRRSLRARREAREE